MALVPIKCPSCGADITMDDERETGFCQFCGTQIQNDAIQRYKVEYSGDPMYKTTFNTKKTITRTTNNVYNIDNRKASMVISKPKTKTLVWGLICVFLSLIGIVEQIKGHFEGDQILISLIFFIIGGICLFFYIRNYRLYDIALKNAIINNDVTNIH